MGFFNKINNNTIVDTLKLAVRNLCREPDNDEEIRTRSKSVTSIASDCPKSKAHEMTLVNKPNASL